jgi:hypothetical protein
MPTPKDNNEIDLLHVIIKILRSFRANLWLIVIFFVIGCLLGFAYFKTKRRVYESEMIVSSTILTDAYSKLLFENVNKHLGQANYAVLSKQFNLPEEVLRQVGSLNTKTLSETNDNKERDRFLITAEVFDQNILPQLEQGLIYYLQNNEFAKVREEQTKNFLKQMIVSVDQEIKELEHLKMKISNGEFFQSAKGNVMFDPTTVNSKIVELTEKKIDYENKLQLNKSVQVIDGFAKFQWHTEPRLSYSIGIGALCGFFISIAIIATRSLIVLVNEEPQ